MAGYETKRPTLENAQALLKRLQEQWREVNEIIRAHVPDAEADELSSEDVERLKAR